MTDWDNTARDAISALHAQLTTNKELRRQIDGLEDERLEMRQWIAPLIAVADAAAILLRERRGGRCEDEAADELGHALTDAARRGALPRNMLTSAGLHE